MEDAATLAARALNPQLSLFESLGGQALKAVWEKKEYNDIVEIVFEFEKESLIVIENDDDDTISFYVSLTNDCRTNEKYIDATNKNPWDNFIGRRFTWGWMAINQQGYIDGLLLSFETIFPALLLNVIASSIKVGVIVQIN